MATVLKVLSQSQLYCLVLSDPCAFTSHLNALGMCRCDLPIDPHIRLNVVCARISLCGFPLNGSSLMTLTGAVTRRVSARQAWSYSQDLNTAIKNIVLLSGPSAILFIEAHALS
jgi:hypothetical protein